MNGPVDERESADDDLGWSVIAEGQAGAIASRQLRDCGLSFEEIKTLRRKKTLRPTAARGVHRVAGAERSTTQELWVALLAGPPGTLASHTTAAALRGLVDTPAIQHVTVPRSANGKFGGAVVHHASVEGVDRVRYDGIEATALGRTIVDCAAILGQKALNSLVDAAFGRNLCSHDEVAGAWERAGRVRGGIPLKEALAPYAGGARPGSVGASRVLRRFHEWGLPLPVCEYQINDTHGEFVAKVDFIWLPWWFILEYDGDEFHARRGGVDARTTAEIESLGFRLERADRGDLRPSSTRLRDVLGSVLLRPPTGPWPVRDRRAPGAPRAA
jgi:hypothetical protein